MTPCDTLIPYPKVHNPINKMQCAYSFLQRHLASSEDDAYILRTPTPIYLSPLFACVNDEDATGKFARDPAAVGVYIRRIGEDLAKKRSELNTLPIFLQNTTIPSIQQLFPAFSVSRPHPSHHVPATVCTQGPFLHQPVTDASLTILRSYVPATASTQVTILRRVTHCLNDYISQWSSALRASNIIS